MKKKITTAVLAAVMMFSLTACSGEASGNIVIDGEAKNSGSISSAVNSGSTGSSSAILNIATTSEGGKNAATYWYIDNRFRDSLGHEFYFHEPDGKGNPTKISISGFSDDDKDNGTFDFRADERTASPAETPNDPWIIGTIVGSGGLMKKDMLADDQMRSIGVDIWFAPADTSGSSTSQQTTSRQATLEDLAGYAGSYVASNGDSFVIPAEPAAYAAVTSVKLDSMSGWAGSEGFYDTFVASSMSTDGNSIELDIASQYTTGNGKLVIEKTGKAALSYSGFSTSGIVNGDYQNSTFTKR